MSNRARGFTLIEMTVALVVGAIVAGFIAMFIATPVNAYMAQNRRNDLSASAESAMRNLSSDLAAALPNSVRTANVGSLRIIEMIAVDGSALYRDLPSAGTEDLQVNTSETQFDVLQPLTISAGARLVIGNRTAPNAQSAYRATNRVITPVGMAQPLAGGTRVLLSGAGFLFGNASAGRRVYVVSTAIQYHCDLATGTLMRYDLLPITVNTVPAAAGGTLIARDVTACAFLFAPPAAPLTAAHGGIATIQMTVSRVTEGITDSMRLARHVRIMNPP
jgi:MSHA biogenesis protein MshO